MNHKMESLTKVANLLTKQVAFDTTEDEWKQAMNYVLNSTPINARNKKMKLWVKDEKDICARLSGQKLQHIQQN